MIELTEIKSDYSPSNKEPITLQPPPPILQRTVKVADRMRAETRPDGKTRYDASNLPNEKQLARLAKMMSVTGSVHFGNEEDLSASMMAMPDIAEQFKDDKELVRVMRTMRQLTDELQAAGVEDPEKFLSQLVAEQEKDKERNKRWYRKAIDGVCSAVSWIAWAQGGIGPIFAAVSFVRDPRVWLVIKTIGRLII